MIIDLISDLHGHFPVLQGGDLLLLAGDYVAKNETIEYLVFFDWLRAQKYTKKVFISGNHDNQAMNQFDLGDAVYLLDSGTEFQGFKIWGSPWNAWCPGMNSKCQAYMKYRDEDLGKKWAKIPDDTQILITHFPPSGILDKCSAVHSHQRIGSKSLLKRLKQLKNLELHVFGHVHQSYGITQAAEVKGVTFVNASHVNESYRPVNGPVRIEVSG